GPHIPPPCVACPRGCRHPSADHCGRIRRRRSRIRLRADGRCAGETHGVDPGTGGRDGRAAAGRDRARGQPARDDQRAGSRGGGLGLRQQRGPARRPADRRLALAAPRIPHLRDAGERPHRRARGRRLGAGRAARGPRLRTRLLCPARPRPRRRRRDLHRCQYGHSPAAHRPGGASSLCGDRAAVLPCRARNTRRGRAGAVSAMLPRTGLRAPGYLANFDVTGVTRATCRLIRKKKQAARATGSIRSAIATEGEMKIDHCSTNGNGSTGLVRSAVAAILALGLAHAGAASAQAATQATGAAASGAATIAANDPQQAAGGPSAADAPASESQLQEIVVTGYRTSLAQALNIKRNMGVEADTILAEDIGKFPDQNLAESLQRIPGVAITREQGEGRQITVRGLGPQFTRVRINGMEALTTTGSPDNEGGVNRTRAFDFNIFSSDLFNSLTIRKTAEADVDEGSLGATVGLSTAHPLDYHHFVFITQAKGNYDDLSGTVGPQLSGLISNVFDDGKFGALASVSWSKRDYLDVGSSTVRWDEAQVLKT